MLKTRIIVAAVLIAIMILLLFVLPPVCLAGFLAFAAAVGSFELIRATHTADKKKSLYVWPALTAAAIPIGTFFGAGEITFRICLSVLMVILFAEAVFTYGKENEVSFYTVLVGFFAGLIIPLCMSALVSMKLLEHGSAIIIMAFVITAVSDTGAYFAGITLGKHKGIVKASPNKSLEGFVGSVVGGLIGIMIFGLIMSVIGFRVNYLALLIYAIVGNITTQLGDLAFSVIKRQNGIKDYGKLMPGHGGVLDRLDSMIFTGPVVLMLFTAYPAF